MTSEESGQRALTWVHRAEQSVDAWARGHARGEVPSEWPYGLDALKAYADVQILHVPDPGRGSRVRARLGLGPGPRDDFALAWDENTAYRMQIVDPHRRFSAGVIWLTDIAANGTPPRRLLEMLRHAASVWVLSEAQVVPLRELLAGARPRVHAIPFGIDSEFFAPSPYPDAPRILSVGNDRDRDPETLYAACEKVIDAIPTVEIIVQSRSTLTPPNGVRLIRQMSHVELRELYASASLVAIATRPNLHGSGMTVALEALSTGRPVVCSGTPGMRQYVREGTTGHLVAPGDVEAFTHAMLGLLREPLRATQMGIAGRVEVERRFTTQTMAASLWAGPLQAA
ncbi:glycosyltransferase family 4 protein [Microbacterium sp. A94]|uniref:glycosyltransferase family 4 protein n=1 Tax=Microbacterium sp. A94 TaxID=3450717 RepID=UPI003F441D15